LNRRLASSIFERERAHAVLRASEARLRHITDNMVDMVGQFDQQAVFQYVSPSYERVLGYLPEELVGRSAIEMIHPDDREQVVLAITAMLKAGTGSAQFRYRHKDGGYRWIESTGRNLMNEKGEVVGSILGSRDITERKRAEEALRRSEQTMRSVLDSVDEGFIVIDREYRILTANRAYCEQVSLPFRDVIGKKCHAVSHKSMQPCHEAGEDCAVRKAFETGEPATAYHKHADAEGSLLYVETKAFPLKNESGEVTSVIESISNITERHLLEQERLKTQKLEAIGTLAGGIAHDFNNLLQGVFSYISLARLKREDPEKSLAALEEAEKALHMSVKLTNQLLTFSKGGKPVRRPTDLRPVIENAAKFALSGSRSTYRILADGLWQAEADEGQIGQVIQNIVLNADQSMPEGGQVEITATNVQAPHPDLPQVLQKGRYVGSR
jgi:PAS domain S-box-containing protein